MVLGAGVHMYLYLGWNACVILGQRDPICLLMVGGPHIVNMCALGGVLY
jgi:hypothetical protein